MPRLNQIVRTMVSGAAAVDVALLVVAAAYVLASLGRTSTMPAR